MPEHSRAAAHRAALMAGKSGSSTPLQTALYITKICTGAGLLGLPHAFQQSGIIAGVLIVILVAFLNAASCRILIHSKRCIAAAAASYPLPAISSSSSSASHEQDTFAHIAQLTLGQYGVHLVHVSIVLTLCGAVSIYIITITTIAAHVAPQLPSLAVLVALFLLLLPFTLLRDLSFFSSVSLLGTVSYLLSFALIFYYGFTTGAEASASPSSSASSPFHLSPSSLSPHSLLDLLSTFGILSFSLGIPVLTFSLQESMQSPQLFSRVMDATMLAVSCGLCLIGVLGVGLFGGSRSHSSSLSPSVHHHSAVHEHVSMDQVQPIILSNLPPDSPLSIAANCLIALTLLLTAPLSLAPALNLLEGILIPQTASSTAASASSSSLPEHKHLLSSAYAPSPSLPASSSHAYASYGGVNDHHDLYNHSSDEDDEAAADSQQAAATPSLSSSRQQQQQPPVRILVRGKVGSLSSNDFVLTPITSSRSTSPSASPQRSVAVRSSSASSSSSSSSLSSSLSAAVAVAAVLLGASVLRALTLLCIVVLAWSVPCFSLIMSCIGLLTLSVLCFVLPPVFYLRLCSLGWAGKEGGSSWYRVWCMAFLAIGALCMIAGAAVVSRMKCE